MTDDSMSRRRLLLAAGFTGSLAGCSGIFNDDTTDTAVRTSPTTTSTPASSPTAEPEANVEITGTALLAETITVGEPIQVEITATNTGDVDGTISVVLNVAGEDVLTERLTVAPGETIETVLTGPETARTGTMTVALNDQSISEVTVEPPTVLHVAPDGDNDNAGTESAPLATIQAAIDRVGPGQTVSVHSGEYVEPIMIETNGTPDAPITLTGPPDAVLTPPEDWEHAAVNIAGSYIHITGLTISGLYDPDEPDNPESYHSNKLIELNVSPEDGDDYIEGLIVSPHRLGNAGASLINSQMIRNCDIGEFEVIGPAGARWVFDDSVDHHNGEIVYLGTAGDNRRDRGFEGWDRSRNIRIHHIDNSAGHPHSELVDCKGGVTDVTIEYCTDGGGAQSDDSYYQPAISLAGQDCTVRWNVIRNVAGSAVQMGPSGFREYLDEPETDLERQMGTDHAVYDNVFTEYAQDAVDFFRESQLPGDDANPLPEDQRVLCGNLFDGYTDNAPGKSCPADLPSGDGVGHLGGDSPWDGTAPTKEETFAEYAMAKDLDTTVEANSVPTGTDIEATVTLTNTGTDTKDVVLQLRVREYVLATERVSIAAGETRDVQLATGGLPNPEEVSITRNGQKIGYMRVTEGG